MCTHTCMVTKTITILDEAYQLLAANKLKNESFSEEILRTFSKKTHKKLSDFFGIISDNEGEEMLAALEKKRGCALALKKRRIQELYS